MGQHLSREPTFGATLSPSRGRPSFAADIRPAAFGGVLRTCGWWRLSPSGQAPVEHPALADGADPSSDDFESNGRPSDDFRSLVEEALRQLNKAFALSGCELVDRLPGTLAAARSLWGDGVSADPTPLEQAQAVREVLVSAIDRLKPPNENARTGAPEALQYHILYGKYVLQRSTRHIMTRRSISESTFHRNRREAVSAIARQLEAKEELVTQGQKQL